LALLLFGFCFCFLLFLRKNEKAEEKANRGGQTKESQPQDQQSRGAKKKVRELFYSNFYQALNLHYTTIERENFFIPLLIGIGQASAVNLWYSVHSSLFTVTLPVVAQKWQYVMLCRRKQKQTKRFLF